MNVVLYGLLGEIEFGGNLFVGQSTAHHLYQLLLTTGEAEIVLDLKIGKLGRLI